MLREKVVAARVEASRRLRAYASAARRRCARGGGRAAQAPALQSLRQTVQQLKKELRKQIQQHAAAKAKLQRCHVRQTEQVERLLAAERAAAASAREEANRLAGDKEVRAGLVTGGRPLPRAVSGCPSGHHLVVPRRAVATAPARPPAPPRGWHVAAMAGGGGAAGLLHACRWRLRRPCPPLTLLCASLSCCRSCAGRCRKCAARRAACGRSWTRPTWPSRWQLPSSWPPARRWR